MEVGVLGVYRSKKKGGFEAGLTLHTKEHDLCTPDDKDISLRCDENENIYISVFQEYIKRYLRGLCVFLQLTCEYYIGEYPVSFPSLHPKSDISLQTMLRASYELSYNSSSTHIGISVYSVCVCSACVASMTGRCSLFGRHHVHTFDGVLYDFPGDCSYLLAGDCNHHSFTLLGESRSNSMKRFKKDLNSNSVPGLSCVV